MVPFGFIFVQLHGRQSILGSLNTDVREPRTATRSRFFSFLERFDAITFETSSHRGPTRAFLVGCEEQKRARKRKLSTSGCRPWLTNVCPYLPENTTGKLP